MIAIIDYGVGNLFSLSSSLSHLGFDNEITSDKQKIIDAQSIILPGVGAFADARQKLDNTGLVELITELSSKKPLLGICLGMQMLFEKSYEYGEHKGLSLLQGEICPLKDDIDRSLKVPHIGWNSLDFVRADNALLKYIKEGDYVYYVHSFYAKNCENSLVATSKYSVDVPGICSQGYVYGTQFHPEKSGQVGLNILKAFGEIR